MLIGFCGLARAGKTTAAARLVDVHGFRRVAFADPLRAMLRALGVSDAEIAAKAEPCVALCGQTPRHALQTLGTEWGRTLIGEDLWLRAWAREAALWPDVVCDDVRFANEAAAIRAAGGIVARLVRPAAGLAGETGRHASERQAFVADVEIANDGDEADLWRRVDALRMGLAARAAA